MNNTCLLDEFNLWEVYLRDRGDGRRKRVSVEIGEQGVSVLEYGYSLAVVNFIEYVSLCIQIKCGNRQMKDYIWWNNYKWSQYLS